METTKISSRLSEKVFLVVFFYEKSWKKDGEKRVFNNKETGEEDLPQSGFTKNFKVISEFEPLNIKADSITFNSLHLSLNLSKKPVYRQTGIIERAVL